jgi:hypothetical protein
MSNFRLAICSDLDYEGMVVDISDQDGRIATISCDGGIENTLIVLFNKENEDPIYKFKFSEFLQILNESFERLKEANSIE